MFLEKISLKQFRNYKSAELSFSSPVTFFFGQNGAGKTALLEAMYCALRGQSFLSSIQAQFIQKGEKKTQISLFLREEEGKSQIQSSFSLENSFLKKELLYCGKKVRNSSLFKRFPCFVFTEASLKCIRQSSYERREFIESLFYTDEQLKAKKEFYQILNQKKQLLKNYKKDLIKEKDFKELFSIINLAFLEKSKKISMARWDILSQWYQFLPEISQAFFNSKPELSFSYRIKEKLPVELTFNSTERKLEQDKDDQSLDVQQKRESQKQNFFKYLEKDLFDKAELEMQTGLLLSGPQKHEILFLFNNEDSRSFCSKGQQRAYVLSLFLSHLKSIPQAFLFLDDVLLELDESVQINFLQLLEKNHCQIFVTNCKMMPLKIKNSSSFYIEKGTARELKDRN